MNLEKLKKYTKIESIERLFGISIYNEEASSMINSYAQDARGYDSDSISSMIDTCENAEDNLNEAFSELEDHGYTLEEWRDLAIQLWESLDKNDQYNYISKRSMSEEQIENMDKAFKLEDLKKL